MTGGRGEVAEGGSTVGGAQGVECVGSHDRVGVPVADLGLEASEEAFLAARPRKDQFHAGDLAAVVRQHGEDLEKSLRQVLVTDGFL